MQSILYVVNDVDYWIHHRLALAQSAMAEGYRVSLAAAPHPHASKLNAHGIAFYPLSLDRFRAGLPDRRLFTELRQLFSSGQFHIVHATTIKPLLIGGLALRSLPRSRRPAFVGTIAGLGRAFERRGVQRWLLDRALATGLGAVANLLIYENPMDADEYVRAGIIDRNRVRVVKGAGVDLNVYHPPEQRDQHGPVRFLFASRLLKAKGVLSFVAAARRLRAAYGTKVEFGLAGPSAPNEPDGLSNTEINTLQKDESIHWYGAVDGSAMPDLLRRHDVFVLPTSYPEGLPRSLVEAGACGLAVVAGDVPGTRALIDPEKDGLLLSGVDPERVTQALERLVTQPGLRVNLAVALRLKIETDGYSLNAINGRYLSFYRQALDRL